MRLPEISKVTWQVCFPHIDPAICLSSHWSCHLSVNLYSDPVVTVSSDADLSSVSPDTMPIHVSVPIRTLSSTCPSPYLHCLHSVSLDADPISPHTIPICHRGVSPHTDTVICLSVLILTVSHVCLSPWHLLQYQPYVSLCRSSYWPCHLFCSPDAGKEDTYNPEVEDRCDQNREEVDPNQMIKDDGQTGQVAESREVARLTLLESTRIMG